MQPVLRFVSESSLGGGYVYCEQCQKGDRGSHCMDLPCKSGEFGYYTEDDVSLETGETVCKELIDILGGSSVPEAEESNEETTTQALIVGQCRIIQELLLKKNRKYGDSAVNPVRTFSSASPIEQINVRIDDKLSRIQSSQEDEDEDVELDLIGYLILKRVAKLVHKES